MDATYDQAAAFCSDSGARLCTEEELLNKCAKNTGCKLNKKLVWSQPIGSPAVLAPTPAPSTPVPSSSPSSFCGPNESEVYLFLTTDYFPSEISWELLDMSSNTVVESRQEGFYDDQFTDYHERMCVSKDLCYKFTIRDDTGHGVLYDGYYSVSYEGVVVRSSDTSIYTPKAYDHEDHSGTNENHHDHHGHDHDHGHGHRGHGNEHGNQHGRDLYHDDDDYNYDDYDYYDDYYYDDYYYDDYYYTTKEESAYLNGDACPSTSPSVSLEPTFSPTSHQPSSFPTELCSPDEGLINLEIKTDHKPRDIFWEVLDVGADKIIKRRYSYYYVSKYTVYTEKMCVPKDSCYKLTMRDVSGDGIGYPGYYELSYEGSVVKRGGRFYTVEEDDYYDDDYNDNFYNYDDFYNHKESYEISPFINGDACPSSSPSISSPPSPSPTAYCDPDEELIYVEIMTDEYPDETKWSLINIAHNETVSKTYFGEYHQESTHHDEFLCVPISSDACYRFEIHDDYGDGICCSEGDGYYRIQYQGSTVVSGGNFGSYQSDNFGPGCI